MGVLFFSLFLLFFDTSMPFIVYNRSEWLQLNDIQECKFEVPPNCSLPNYLLVKKFESVRGCQPSGCFPRLLAHGTFRELYNCSLICRSGQPVATNSKDPSSLPYTPDNMVVTSAFKAMRSLYDTTDFASDPSLGVIVKGISPVNSISGSSLWMLVNTTDENMFSFSSGCDPSTKRIAYYQSGNGKRLMHFFIDCDLLEGQATLSFNMGGHISTVSRNALEMKSLCVSGGRMVSRRWIDPSAGGEEKAFYACLNGSSWFTERRDRKPDCSIVYIKSAFIVCSKENHDCSVDTIVYTRGEQEVYSAQIVVTTRGTSQTLFKSELESLDVACKEKCSITIKSYENIFVTCESGKTMKFTREGKLTDRCTSVPDLVHPSVAMSLCRVTQSPTWLILTVCWVFLGLYITRIAALVVVYFYSIIRGLINRYRAAATEADDYCPSCDDEISYNSLWEFHKTCGEKVCPYCRSKHAEEFKPHVASCKSKEKRLTIERAKYLKTKNLSQQNNLTFSQTYKSPINNLVYIAICVTLVLVLATGVRGTPVIDEDIYLTQYQRMAVRMKTPNLHYDSLVNCDNYCIPRLTDCDCRDPKSFKSRRLLSDAETDRIRPQTHQLHAYHIGKTYLPTSDQHIITMDIISQYSEGGKQKITGNSIISMPVSSGVGVVWEIRSSESDEKARIVVGLVGARQKYEAVFERWLTDRNVQRGSEVMCTGTCSSDCACKDTTCHRLKLDKDRSWGCNPADCLSISTGCTCCWVKATAARSGSLMGLWAVKYLGTEVSLCMDYKSGHSCRTISSSGSIELGPITLKVEDVTGVTTTLPATILTATDYLESKLAPHLHTKIFLDPGILASETVSHGDLGDFSFKNITVLMTNNPSGVAMQWRGVSISRHCAFARTPTCVYQGLELSLRDIIDSKFRSLELLNTSFIDLGSRLSITLDTPSLDIKVSPKLGAGQLKLLLSANDIALHRRSTAISIGLFKIISCSGCYNCKRAAYCVVKVSLTSEDKYNIHITSPDRNVAVMQNSILASHSLTLANVTFFTPVSVNRITLCVEEKPDTCSTIESVTLEDAPNIYVPGDHYMIDTTKAADSTGLRIGMLATVGNFFGELSHLYNSFQYSLYFLVILFTLALCIWIARKIGLIKIVKRNLIRRVLKLKKRSKS